MEKSTLFKHLLDTWQSLVIHGVWHQDAFLLFMCVITVVMLFFSGTVLGLFVQSLWGIFITSRHQNDTDHQ